MKLPGQANPYVGFPQRAWMLVRLHSLDGDVVEVHAMVDTGSPYSLLLPDPTYEQFVHRYIRSLESNFGMLTGGWLRVTVPGTRLDEDVIAYGSETILRILQQSDRSLNALVGLPLLRRLEYGGDADRFWIRDASR